MHEASIVRELIALAVRMAPVGARVLEVHVRVGRLSAVSPDAMQFYFEVMRDEALGSQAVLRVELEPLRGRCRGCGRGSALDEPCWTCPACGGTLAFENGDELDLASLVVADEQRHNDRAEDPRQERRAGAREPAGD
jgi:hydrogenase nickel incorporation protein HypA/HybF